MMESWGPFGSLIQTSPEETARVMVACFKTLPRSYLKLLQWQAAAYSSMWPLQVLARYQKATRDRSVCRSQDKTTAADAQEQNQLTNHTGGMENLTLLGGQATEEGCKYLPPVGVRQLEGRDSDQAEEKANQHGSPCGPFLC